MKQKKFYSLSVLLILLIAAAAMLTGCSTRPAWVDVPVKVEKELGDGQIAVTVYVVNDKNEASVYTLHTDAPDLRTALTEAGIIPPAEAGSLVLSVDGLTADWGKDQSYWGLYIGEAVATVGVDAIRPENGAIYALVYTK